MTALRIMAHPFALNFTGHADLLSTYAELRMDIFRARCNGRVNHDAERRQAAIVQSLRDAP